MCEREMVTRSVADSRPKRPDRGRLALGLAVGLAAALLAIAGPQVTVADGSPRVQIWSDRGAGGVYRVGDCAQLAFRPEVDCYVIVYGIDTDGYLRVLFPGECDDNGYVLGGRTYSIWRDGFYKFYVNGPTGVEYVHVLASYEPFRQVYWQGCGGYDDYAREATWRGFHDYWGAALPPRVYGDPYAAMQMIDEFICVDALEAGQVWADFTYFYVGERVRYPRYLCYDCHGFNPGFRPYSDVCAAFSVSFVDCDPSYSQWSWWWWCSPRRVYCGPSYVCHGKDDWGGDRGDGHGSERDGDHATYPSEYKWKSRGEGAGLTVAAVVRTPVTKGGNMVDAVRVKARETERDLDSRKGSGGGESPERQRAAVTRDARERETDGREARQVETRKAEVKGHESRSEKSKASQIKSGDSSSRSKPKGVNPEVRRGDKGKSPVARRKVSK
jgi:hypothetical protein